MKIAISLATLIALVVSAPFSFSEEVTYRQHIKPLFDAKCRSCHGPDSPEYQAFKEEKDKWVSKGKGPRMDTYSHLIFYTAWPDTGALMRRLDDGRIAEKQGNMYQYLGSTEDDRQKNLKLFKEWIGNWATKKWSEITKEEMDGIKVRY